MTPDHAGVRGGETAGPLSHVRRWTAETVQSVSPPGVLDLGPGYLDPTLLPVDLLRQHFASGLERFGSAALSYGHNQGAFEFREEVARRAVARDGHPCSPEQAMLTAGTSHGLHLVSTILTEPGSVVFLDSACYDLARRLFVDCELVLREISADEHGMSPDALHRALASARSGGERPGFVYLNPTFHNPTGLVVPTNRRAELLSIAARHGTLIVEDEPYAELTLDAASPPPSMAALAGYRGVVRLQSFSKTLAPGLRVGSLLAEPDVVARLSEHGLFASGGAANHATALAVVSLLRAGDYDQHLDWLRRQLTVRRDALVGALRQHLTEDYEFDEPGGGFFVWIRSHLRGEPEIVAAADRAGVGVSEGSRFGHVPTSVRLAFSFNPPELLTAAGERLAAELAVA
ncbi:MULTISPECIES: aminotransferase class I/II-fold pyridoxal phosphate-dependent enzyme [Actinoalloteichus]|uniref:aminotransferase class I/II-fold pyridoxal phosphate-dependent enzyme n=1 Tax=Actinoalloteichus TaxID=65496 RepID=UPI00068E5958|nr:aminotransferase class I/II-fold pyridoxal phosphate-dependent enzyme [Actinoalloteichus caeruleus]